MESKKRRKKSALARRRAYSADVQDPSSKKTRAKSSSSKRTLRSNFSASELKMKRREKDVVISVKTMRGSGESREALCVLNKEDGSQYEDWLLLTAIRDLQVYKDFRLSRMTSRRKSPSIKSIKHHRKNKSENDIDSDIVLSPRTANQFRKYTFTELTALPEQEQPAILKNVDSLTRKTHVKFNVDDLIIINMEGSKEPRVARIRFVGRNILLKGRRSDWIGVEILGEPAIGETDGVWPLTRPNKRYFKCRRKRGAFIRKKQIIDKSLGHVKRKHLPEKNIDPYAGILRQAFFLGYQENTNTPKPPPKKFVFKSATSPTVGAIDDELHGEHSTNVDRKLDSKEKRTQAKAGKNGEGGSFDVKKLSIKIPKASVTDKLISDAESSDDLVEGESSLPRVERGISVYEIRSPIVGQGAQGYVKEAEHKDTHERVALKFLVSSASSDTEADKETFNAELNVKSVKSPHVINLKAVHTIDSEDEQAKNVLVYEFAPGGELFEMLAMLNILSEEVCRTYFHQLISGLEACHRKGIVHRDIKPQNILLKEDKGLLIADFGVSRTCSEKADSDDEEHIITEQMDSWVGTEGYRAPEMIWKKTYSASVDIFASGVVLFLLLTGRPPFELASCTDLYYHHYASNEPEKFWEDHAKNNGIHLSPSCMDLINHIFAEDPKKRATLSFIKQHEWYNQETLSPMELKSRLEDRIAEVTAAREAEKKRIQEIRDRPVLPLKEGPCIVDVTLIPLSDLETEPPEPMHLMVSEKTELLAILHHVRKQCSGVEKVWDSIQVTRGVSFVDVDREYEIRTVVSAHEDISVLY